MLQFAHRWRVRCLTCGHHAEIAAATSELAAKALRCSRCDHFQSFAPEMLKRHANGRRARVRGALLDAGAVENEWSGILRIVRAGTLAVPSRCQQRLPNLTAHDVAEIDREVRDVLNEIGYATSWAQNEVG
jgi:phage terminase Nu1 subunit (DNA packaging protein)